MSGHYDAYNRQHTTINQSSLPAASRCAAAPTARGAITPCMVLTAKRPRMPPSSGTSTPCVTAAITTTAKRAFTTSRAGITTLPTAGSSTPTPSLPPTPTASSARKAFGYYKKTAHVKGKKFVLNQLYASITKVSAYSYVRGIHR